MAFLNQIEHFEPHRAPICQPIDEPVQMECTRLIHAAVISQAFLNRLLTNPLKAIDEGFGGEKFSFTHQEKQSIMLIRASTLAEFANQLFATIEFSPSVAEMAYTS